MLTSRWISPTSVPKGQLKTSGYFDRTCSVVNRACSAGEVHLGSGGGTEVKLSLWTVMMFIC